MGSIMILSTYTVAATWQDVGTLSGGIFPNTSCQVQLASPTANSGVFRNIVPVSIYKDPYDLKMDFSNYTVDQLRDFFIDVPNNNWESFYQSYQSAQKKYPYHTPKFNISIYKNNNYFSTSSMLVLVSGGQQISVGTPIQAIASHPYIKIQQFCLS